MEKGFVLMLKIVVLNWGCHSEGIVGNTWRHFWLVQLARVRTRVSYWHLVG